MRNLARCRSEFDAITIRTNIDRGNRERAPEMFRMLVEGGLGKAKLHFVPTYAITSACAHCSPECFTEKEAAEALLQVWRQAIAAGFAFDWKPSFKILPCWAHSASSFAIDPEGLIYKCAHAYGTGRHVAGHIKSGHTDEPYSERDPLRHAKCRACPLLPLCGGGCAHRAEWRTGSIMEMDCEDALRGYLLELMTLLLERENIAAA